jgi:hypothetical protein
MACHALEDEPNSPGMQEKVQGSLFNVQRSPSPFTVRPALLGHLDLLNASFLRTDLNPKRPQKEELKQ